MTLQLFVLVVLVPFILVILTEGSIKAIKGVGLITLMSGLGMAIPQVIAAKFVGAELPAIVGSLCSIVGLAKVMVCRNDRCISSGLS